jgi:hypothetical protein
MFDFSVIRTLIPRTVVPSILQWTLSLQIVSSGCEDFSVCEQMLILKGKSNELESCA